MKTAPVQFENALNRAVRAGSKGTATPSSFASQLRAAMAADENQRNLLKDGKAQLDPSLLSMPLRSLSAMDMVRGIKGPVKELSPLNPPTPPLMPITDDDRVPGVRKPSASEQEKVEATARKWLAQTFYGTMLKQMRQSPFKSKLFEGGRGGEAFTSMLDQRLADHMARGTDKKLASAITRKIMGRAGRSEKAQSAIGNRQSALPQHSGLSTQDSVHVTPGLRA